MDCKPEILNYLQLKIYACNLWVDMQAAQGVGSASRHAAGSESIPTYVFNVSENKRKKKTWSKFESSDMSLHKL
jgi:hypothetical protein